MALELLGVALSGAALAVDLFSRFKNSREWREEDKLADEAWLQLALQDGDLESGPSYRWSNPEKVAVRLRGDYEMVYVFDEKERTKFRVVNKSGQVLIAKRASRLGSLGL